MRFAVLLGVAAATVVSLSLFCRPARATWYSENVRDGSDIIMMDLRWPWWPSGTYYANWNSGFNPKPNNISFYSGFTSTVPDGPGSRPNQDQKLEATFRPGTVWSFWGSSADGTPVRFVDTAPNLFLRNMYGGEGLSGTLGAEGWSFIHSQSWYRMLARVWPMKDGTGTSCVGRWIKDMKTGQWHLIAIARLPIEATSFVGNSGFIEPLTSEKAVRSLHRRLGYARKDGHWYPTDTIAIDKTEYVVVNKVLEGDHEYAAIEYAQRSDLIPMRLTGRPLAGDKRFEFKVMQPERPTLDAAAVTGVEAQSVGGQVMVKWHVPDTAAPQLSYRIALFRTSDCKGAPLATHEERMPGVSIARVSASSAVTAPWVRLTITDVFDQTSKPVVLRATPLPALQLATPVSTVRPGLTYVSLLKETARNRSYFYSPLQVPDEQHRWIYLNEAKTGKPQRSGISRGFDLSVLEEQTAGSALQFTGLLKVPASGMYLFSAQIDGAYRLKIGNTTVLEWDGQHGSTRRTASIGLSAGMHPISLEYLYDALPAQNFELSWEGPGLKRSPIGPESLYLPASHLPEADITARDMGLGTADVRVKVTTNGRHLDRIALYLGSLQLASSAATDGSLVYHGPLPAGSNTLWARVIYDRNHTVDTIKTTLAIRADTISAEWTAHNVGDQRAPHNITQIAPDAFQFFGSGMHTVSKQITGDFTATCHVDAYNGSHGEPVNRRAWVGLTAREKADGMNWEWGTDFHLVQTAADGLRCSPDNSDLGAERIASYEMPHGHSWLRIQRRGNAFTAWTSANGTEWQLGGYQYRRARPEMSVGLFLSALPQEARAHYSASVSRLSVVSDNAITLPAPAAITDGRTAGNRLTGVVVSLSNPKVVMVRSAGDGVLRSEDGGNTWRACNAGITGPDLSVRSIAIHPANPRVVFRGGGNGNGSALWRSEDGGDTWDKLIFPGDFDGEGPSSLCGEVIGFDLRNPEIVYVGCESAGLFKSPDSGRTWTRIGLQGERITAVTVWPWERYYPATARGKTQIGITTCPDAFMALLGRGTPKVTTSTKNSRSYSSPDGVQTLSLLDERPDTGFYNIAFDKATQNIYEFTYATSHGVQSNSGGHMSLFPPQKSLDWLSPCTALGASARGEDKFGRFLTMSLLPADMHRVSLSTQWAFEWSWIKMQGGPAAGGLIAIAPDRANGDRWWFLFSDGLYRSDDGGAHLLKLQMPGVH